MMLLFTLSIKELKSFALSIQERYMYKDLKINSILVAVDAYLCPYFL